MRRFLTQLPEVRSRPLAFNRGATFADAFAVATPLLAADGTLVAAISAAVDPADADRLDDLREDLKKAIATLGPRCGLGAPAEPAARLSSDPHDGPSETRTAFPRLGTSATEISKLGIGTRQLSRSAAFAR